MNDVVTNSPRGLLLRSHEPSGLSLLVKRAATNAFRYISSQLPRSIIRYTGVFPIFYQEKSGWSLLLFLLLAHENLTGSGCNRSCFIPHDVLNKRVAVPFVLQRVRSSTHFTSDRMCLEYGGGRLVLISEP